MWVKVVTMPPVEEDVARFVDKIASGNLAPDVTVVERRRPDVWNHPWRLKPVATATAPPTDEEIVRRRALVRDLYETKFDGVYLTVQEIARRIQASDGTVLKDIRELGLTRHGLADTGKRRREQKERDAKIKELLETTTYTVEEIGPMVGVHPSAVSSAIKRMGMSGLRRKGVGVKGQRVRERQTQVAELWQEGIRRVVEIAERTGWAESTIQGDINELGLRKDDWPEKIADAGPASGALRQMATMSDVILSQDTTSITLDEGQREAWARAIGKIRKALNHAKRAINEGNGT